MSSLSLAVTFLGLGLMLVLVGVLTRHKLYYIFPPFFAYCVFAPCVEMVDVLLSKHPIPFFVAHWLAQGVYVVLAFLAMLSVLRPYTNYLYIRHPWSQLLLLPFVALVLALPVWNAASNPIHRTATGRFASAIYLFVILISVAEVTLWAVSARSKELYVIYWRDQVFAIVRGFGVLASINLIAYIALVLRLLHLKVAPDLESIFQLAPSAAFIGSTVVWLMAFWNPKDLPKEPPDFGKMRDALRIMQQQLDADIEYVKEIGRRFGIRLVGA